SPGDHERAAAPAGGRTVQSASAERKASEHAGISSGRRSTPSAPAAARIGPASLARSRSAFESASASVAREAAPARRRGRQGGVAQPEDGERRAGQLDRPSPKAVSRIAEGGDAR